MKKTIYFGTKITKCTPRLIRMGNFSKYIFFMVDLDKLRLFGSLDGITIIWVMLKYIQQFIVHHIFEIPMGHRCFVCFFFWAFIIILSLKGLF